jgi:type II secretory pathway pseudopilin PulG
MLLNRKNSYSLVELSISLAIVALLISSGTTIFAKKSEIDKIKLTRTRIDIIEKAIAAYVDLNGYIPCPATGASIETDAYFGDSLTNASYNTSTHLCSNNTTNNVGMVPVRNLGLEDKYAYDGWDRKFSFQIATGMGNATDFTDINYKGDLDVVDRNGVNITNRLTPSPNNYGAAYVIVSFGQDGTGAWAKNSSTTPTAPSSTNIEYNNSLYLSGGNSYGSNIYIKNTSSANFNHLVTFKTKPMLTTTKMGISPVRIPKYVCYDANAIATAGFPMGSSFSGSLTGTVTSSASIGSTSYTASNTSLPAQIYLSAMKTKKLCNNPPIATINVNINSNSSCSFNPKSVSVLKLWLDGNDPNGTGVPVATNTSITTWYDKSGNSHNGSGTGTSTNPNYIYSNKGALSSNKSTIRFDGSSNQYSVSPGVLNSGSTYTIFVISALGNSAPNPSYVMNLSSSGSPLSIYYANTTPYINVKSLNSTALTSSTDVYSAIIPSLMILNQASAAQKLSVILSSGGYYLYQNTLSSSYPSTGSGYIGSNGGTSYFLGDIGEILLYSPALSPSDTQTVSGYLLRKWIDGEC